MSRMTSTAIDPETEFTKDDLVFLSYALGYFTSKFPTAEHPHIWDDVQRIMRKIERLREKLHPVS
jgi:hypothetical protein